MAILELKANGIFITLHALFDRLSAISDE